jgi:hypothetical protein
LRRMKGLYIKPWIFGVAAGIMFVSAEAFLPLYPPAAYSFCLTCHVRDLVNTIVNHIFVTHFETAFIARRVIMLTSPALVIGAFLTSRAFGEYRRVKSESPLIFFLSGFAVMIVGILIFGCPTRIVIRTAYGDLYGIVGFAGLFGGVWIGTEVMKRIWIRRM